MPGLVLDASVALAYVLPDEAATDAVWEVMRQARTEPVFVPPLWAAEVGNALVIRRRKRLLSDAEVARILAKLSELTVQIDWESTALLWTQGLRLAFAHELTLYDAMYLEIATRRRLPLATLDQALRRAARAEGLSLLA